jgi:glutamate N-acetyltransferase/amino-acid N-acetyltransferase
MFFQFHIISDIFFYDYEVNIMQFKFIDGGVAAAEGFTASGVLNKIKASRTTYDTALIYSDTICNAAGVFTQNRVKAECVKFTKSQIADGKAQAVIMNSGNANACTGKQGYENAAKEAKAVSEKLNVAEKDVLVCSTGVIG